MVDQVDSPGASGYEDAQPSREESDAVVYQELAAIVPTIAATMARQSQASVCAFYIYDDDLARTVTTFRHGELQVSPTDLSYASQLSPLDIPVEAEILNTHRSIRRSTDEDFERYPMIIDQLRVPREEYADVVVPLCRRDQVYGVVYLARSGEPGPFTDVEVVALESLAQVAAMAVEFARQYSDERVRRLRLNALLNVASLAASHLTVDQVMPAFTRIVRTVTEADVCNLYVLGDSGDEVVNWYSSGLNEREKWVFDDSHRYQVSSVPAEERARNTLEPVVIRDPENDLVPGSELIVYSRASGISEILVVPVVYQQSMIGVAYIWYRDGSRMFRDDAISAVQGIANQAGAVVSQARLYDESQHHMSETEALRKIGETVLNCDSLNEVLDQIAGVLEQMIPHDYGFFGRVDEADDAVVIERIWGKFPPAVLNYRISTQESLTGEAFRTGKILNLPNAFQDPRMHRYEPEYLPIRSVLIAPLVTENGTVGVLYIAREESGGFASHQERLMELLSQQAGAALERTQARLSLALHAQRQTFLANVTNWLIAAPDPAWVLKQICEAGCGVLADGVGIALSSWEYGDIRWVGAAHRDPDFDPVVHRELLDQVVQVDPDRVEAMLAAEAASLMLLDEGRPTDGRALDPTAIDLLRRTGTRQILTVPMRQSGRAPGLMVLMSSDQTRALDDDLQEMAQNVANRIGDALERRQMARNRESLLLVSEAINAHDELDDLLEMFAAELHRIVPYDQMYLGRADLQSGTMQPLKFVNPHGLSGRQVDLASNQGISGEVMQTRKAILDNRAHERPASTYGSAQEASYYAEYGESAIAAPLIAENEVLGVLFIGRTGANRFSESDFETFLLFSGLAASAIHRTELLQKNQLMYRASVEVLAAVVDAKDPTTLEHSRNVARYARIIAEEASLTPLEIERVELAGLLHDIGKLSVPDHVLGKPGPLTPQERALIRTHPERGANILNQHPALMNLVPLVRHHHERVDGNGYPDGLSGDTIPLGASIISVADAFDTMTSHRTYQRKKSISEALDELQRCAGTQFDVGLVELFFEAIRRHPESERNDMTREAGTR